MDNANSVLPLILSQNRSLRGFFALDSRASIEKALQWLCSEAGCELAAYLAHSGETNRLAVSLVVDLHGRLHDVGGAGDLSFLPPPKYDSISDNMWVEPDAVGLPQSIRQRLDIVKPVQRAFFRLNSVVASKDLICLMFRHSAWIDNKVLRELTIAVNCLSCLIERQRLTLLSNVESKQLEFLMHLYEGSIPGLESAYRRVLEAVAGLVKCKRHAIWAINHRTDTATLVDELGYADPDFPRVLRLGEAFVGMGARQQKPLLISNVYDKEYDHLVRVDNKDLRAKVIVPVFGLDGEGGRTTVTHVLVMYPSDPDYEFESEVFRAASERIAIYLFNAAIVEQHRFVQLLLECGAGAPGLHEYLQKVVDLIIEIIRVQGCSIYYYDDVWEKLLLGGSSGLVGNPPSRNVMYDVEDRAATVECFIHGVPIVYDDVQGADHGRLMFKYREQTKDKGQTFAAVPIRSPGNAVTGVIRCTNKLVPRGDRVDFFASVDRDLLDFVGRIVGYHIELRFQDRRRNEVLDRTMHEVYNPASAIRITAETLIDRRFTLHPARIDSMLSDIVDYAKLLDWLAESVGFFTLSKPERQKRYKRKTVVLDDVFADVKIMARPIAKSRGRYFDAIEFSSNNCRVLFDRECLVIVVVNLVANAIKYFDESRCEMFKVITAAIPCARIRSPVTGQTYRNVVVVRVSDWGIGVPASDQPRLFEPGFRGTNALRLDDTGQGLGLSLANMIVKDFDGEVYLEQSVNPTVFAVIIPQKGRQG